MKQYSFGIVPATKVGSEYLFLIIQHKAGHWGFPKGRRNGNGETDEETAVREFREETGLHYIKIVPDISFIEYYDFVRDGITIHKKVTFLIGLLPEKKEVDFQLEEIQDYQWATYEEAKKILTYEEPKKILKQIKKYLENKKV